MNLPVPQLPNSQTGKAATHFLMGFSSLRTPAILKIRGFVSAASYKVFEMAFYSEMKSFPGHGWLVDTRTALRPGPNYPNLLSQE